MIVILWTSEKKYFSNKANCHWVEDIKGATVFGSLEKATNYAKNGLKDKVHMLEYIEVASKDPGVLADDTPVLTKEEAEKAYDELRAAAQAFGKAAESIPAIMKYYQAVQEQQDKLQEDLLHKFEFTSPGNIIFVKLGRMLKACRLKRREAKDRLGYLITIDNTKARQLLQAHNHHDNLIETREYAPRIAPELFN